MLSAMFQRPLFWLLCLSLWFALLIWRLVDFFDEENSSDVTVHQPPVDSQI